MILLFYSVGGVMVKKIFKRIYKYSKIISIIIVVSMLSKVNIVKENTFVSNENLNKTLDLTAMAIKIEEIQMNDKYYVLDTFTGDMTAYMANCPLCNGSLGCTGQNVLDGTTTYNDNEYGVVNIVASSSNLPCGSIIQYNDVLNGYKKTAIVLDRGVLGNAIDLLVNNTEYAYQIGRRQITYDVLRFGYERENS